MHQYPLEQFASDKGQVTAARLLGMSQGALSKALRLGRQIVVTEHPDGTCVAKEERPFPSQARRSAV